MRIRTTQFATIVVLLTSFLLSPAAFAAQTSTNDWSRLTSVAAGSKVTVKLKNGKTIDGKFSSVSDTALALTVKNASREVARDDVLTVHYVVRKDPTKATLIGLGLGIGAAAIVGTSGSGSGFDSLDAAVTGVMVVLGAGVGALGGFLVGRSGKKRVLIYEAK
jgi:small nuclear ribonucleoprotein (snRNP)-like protein